MHRFHALTGFRCLAACMVFVYHNRKYWREILPNELLRWVNECHLGVSLFFVLSGFLIAYTYADAPLRSRNAYGRYMLVRAARILPLYWLLLAALSVFPLLPTDRFTWLTFTLAHGFSDVHNLDGIAQAWSLTVEMGFYLLAPVLCFLQRKHFLYLALAFASLFFLFWLTGQIWFQLNGNPQRFFYPRQFLIDGTLPGHAVAFMAGMWLAHTRKNKPDGIFLRIPNKTAIGFLGIVLVMYAIGRFQPSIYAHGRDHWAGQLLQSFVLPVFVALGLAGLINERTLWQQFLGSRVMVLLGNASFAFYLVHISYVNMRLKTWFLLPDRNFTALWLIAILLYLLFEKPVYDFARRQLKRTA